MIDRYTDRDTDRNKDKQTQTTNNLIQQDYLCPFAS